MKQIKEVKYINPDTGEFHKRQYWVDMLFNDEGYLLWSNKSNVKTFLDVPLPDIFTWAEQGRIAKLKHYILRDNQLLVYRSNATIKPLDIKNICKILEMSNRQCRSFIRKLKKANVIKEISFNEEKFFAFSPIYGFKGKRLTLTVFIFFQEELKDILPEWVVKQFTNQAKELAFSIRIIK